MRPLLSPTSRNEHLEQRLRLFSCLDTRVDLVSALTSALLALATTAAEPVRELVFGLKKLAQELREHAQNPF